MGVSSSCSVVSDLEGRCKGRREIFGNNSALARRRHAIGSELGTTSALTLLYTDPVLTFLAICKASGCTFCQSLDIALLLTVFGLHAYL